MSMPSPIDRGLGTWLPKFVEGKFQEWLDALRLKVAGLDTAADAGAYLTQDIGSAVQTAPFTGLAGDTDGGYLIEGTIVTGAASPVFSLQPNGLTTNQLGREILIDTAVNAPVSVATLRIAQAGATVGSEVSFKAYMTSKSGRVRHVYAQSFWKTGGGAQVMDNITSEWTDTAAVITSVNVFSSVASGIGIGSKLTLKRLGNPLL
jgi:hypothetical protein